MRYPFFFLLFVSTALWTLPKKEQEPCPPPSKYFSIRHIEPNGVGYTQGYTTLELFALLRDPPNSLLPFVDGRVHFFDHGQGACNIGIGARYLFSSWIVGANGYYDYRKTKHHPYHQLSVGFEALSPYVDLRVNGYFPCGNAKSPLFDPHFSRFAGHRVILWNKKEFAMTGMNAEVGGYFRKLYLAAGPYYFNGEGKTAVGGKVRAKATFYDTFFVEASGSYDPVFRWIGQGEMGLRFSFGPTKRQKTSCGKTPALWYRAVQSVNRNEIIVLDQKKVETEAINPLNNQPYTFYFIDDRSSSQGTIESPFPTIAEAETASSVGDILYIYPGTGDGYSVGDAGMTLKNRQKFWGSSTHQWLSTAQGNILIPAQTRGKPLIIGGAAANGMIHLGDGNEVSGLHIQGNESLNGRAILGGNSTIQISGGTIRNNQIDGSFNVGGIFLGANGKVVVENNHIAGSVDAVGGSSIDIRSYESGSLQALIANNTIAIEPSLGANCYVILGVAYGTSDLNLTISGNHITTTSTGGGLHGFDIATVDQSSMNVTFSGNTLRITNLAGNARGLYLGSSTTSRLMGKLESNTFSVTSEGGISYGYYISGSDTGQMEVDVFSNSITVTGDDTNAFGIYAVEQDGSFLSGLIENNTGEVSGATTNVGIDAGGSHMTVGNNSIVADESNNVVYEIQR